MRNKWEISTRSILTGETCEPTGPMDTLSTTDQVTLLKGRHFHTLSTRHVDSEGDWACLRTEDVLPLVTFHLACSTLATSGPQDSRQTRSMCIGSSARWQVKSSLPRARKSRNEESKSVQDDMIEPCVYSCPPGYADARQCIAHYQSSSRAWSGGCCTRYSSKKGGGQCSRLEWPLS